MDKAFDGVITMVTKNHHNVYWEVECDCSKCFNEAVLFPVSNKEDVIRYTSQKFGFQIKLKEEYMNGKRKHKRIYREILR